MNAIPDPSPPPHLVEAASTLFGNNLPLAQQYAELLMADGVLRGLIGPREAPRIWDRHLLNCAAVIELIGEGAHVIDVGSGAGLPGIVLALARPDLTVTLLEPMARRTVFLEAATDLLRLTQVDVVRARAEEYREGVESADVVVSRALAPLDRLTAWCLPLAIVGGRVLALKGDAAASEVAVHAGAVRRLGGGAPTVRACGVGTIEPPTTVVEVVRERVTGKAGRRR